jgi:hypothetical protein
MNPGPRDETKKWINTARNVDPLALGPFLGHHALRLDIPIALIAESLDVHEQTVLRWMTGRALVPPPLLSRVVKLISFLCWMYDEKLPPLVGNTRQKEQQLAGAMTTFLANARGLQKTTVRA